MVIVGIPCVSVRHTVKKLPIKIFNPTSLELLALIVKNSQFNMRTPWKIYTPYTKTQKSTKFFSTTIRFLVKQLSFLCVEIKLFKYDEFHFPTGDNLL